MIEAILYTAGVGGWIVGMLFTTYLVAHLDINTDWKYGEENASVWFCVFIAWPIVFLMQLMIIVERMGRNERITR